MGFSRQRYWSGLPFPSPGGPPEPGMEPVSLRSLALVGGFFTTSITWEAHCRTHWLHSWVFTQENWVPCAYKKRIIWMCLAVFIIIAPKWKSTQMAIKVNGHTNCSMFIQWSTTQQGKGKKPLVHVTIRIKLRDSMLSKTSWILKRIHIIVLFTINSVQLLSCIWLFVTPWTAAHQASLFITNSRILLKLMSTESLMLSNHLILCHLLLLLPSIFPSIRVFSNESVFASGGQTIGASASASVLPMNVQDWFPLGWAGLISLQFKGLSRVFSNTTVQKHQFFGAQLLSSKTGKTQLWCCSKSECWLPLVGEFIGWEGAWESFWGWCSFKRNLNLNSGYTGIYLCKGPSSCTHMFCIPDCR